MMFKKIRSVHLPYNKQGYIWFMLHNFEYLEPQKQERIIMLTLEVAGKHKFPELWELLTGDGNIQYIQTKYHFDNVTRIYNMRREFYERYFDFCENG